MTPPHNRPAAVPSPVELRDLAIDIAREAAALVAAHADDHLVADTKSTPTDAVTEVDRAAERLIVERITAARPDDAILGEEGTSRPGSTGVRWVIDPLDGTVNFIYGIRVYSVSIGVEVDGERTAAAVVDAATGRIYDAARGSGARADGEAITCSDVTDLGMALTSTGFGYSAERRAKQAEIVAMLLPKIRDLRRIGSAALDLCAVAAGHVDAYFEYGINPWDRAAGLLIAEEAGAQVAIIDGPMGGLTIAAPPAIFDALLTEVKF